jgi:hypothetical protein
MQAVSPAIRKIISQLHLSEFALSGGTNLALEFRPTQHTIQILSDFLPISFLYTAKPFNSICYAESVSTH